MSLKISQLTPASTPLTGAELVEVVQAGQSRRVPVSQLSGAGAQSGIPFRLVTASDTVTPVDAGKMILCNSSSPITLTISAESAGTWAIDGVIPVFHVLQLGTGAVNVVGSGFSVTVNPTDTNVLFGVSSPATLMRIAADSWRMIGRLGAA